MLKLTIRGDGLPSLAEAAETLGSEAKAKRAYRRALNEAGRDVTAPTYRSLAKQTGLKTMVARRALKAKKANMKDLTFELRGKGGFINLKYFGARETRPGVSAAPWGRRQIFAGSFINGGFFPNRKTLRFEGTVFEPKGKAIGYDRVSRGLIIGKDKSWGRKFKRSPSGVRIPDEMVKGVTAQTFQDVGGAKLRANLARHIKLVTKGVLS